jgi:tetratricopeptide (TPR) repeat protein
MLSEIDSDHSTSKNVGMLNEQEKIYVEQLIDNSLSAEERKLLDDKLNESEFVAEIMKQRAVALSIRKVHESNLKAELKELLTDEDYSDRESNSKKFRIWYAAAAVAAIITVSFLIFKPGAFNAETAFLTYYKAYPVGANTRGADEDLEEQAYSFYQQGQYDKAAISIEKLSKEYSGKNEKAYLQLLLGNCYLNLNKLNEARDCFTMATESTDVLIVQNAQWYFALTLIKSGNIKEAKTSLKIITDSNSVYSSQAKDIIDHITE